MLQGIRTGWEEVTGQLRVPGFGKLQEKQSITPTGIMGSQITPIT